jgi:hypothetical protein
MSSDLRWVAILVATALAACQQPGFTTCGDLVCPQGYQCRDQRCVSNEQVAVCREQEEESACVAGLDGLCREGYCQIDLCGNGELDSYPERGDETCDGELGRLACADAGADFGLTQCTVACVIETKSCESFSWRRAIAGGGPARAAVTQGGGLFVARSSLVSWNQGGPWKNSPRINNPVLDLVALSRDQALAIAPRSAATLGIWHYKGATNELEDTGLSVSISGAGRWSDGVALDPGRVLASVSQALRLYVFSGGVWTDNSLTSVACPVGEVTSLWASSPTTVYGAIGTRVLRLAVSGATVTCTVVQDLGQPVVALGGQGTTLTWAVNALGHVYDASTWTVRNTDLAATVAVDSAVAQYVGEAPRLWATDGGKILMFEGGAWWQSSSGSTVLRDDLLGHLGTHRPLVVLGERILAVQPSQEAGLVERNAREWFTGWETQESRGVVDVAVDGRGQAWSLLEGSRVLVGSREGDLLPALTPLSPLAFVAGVLFVGSNGGVFRIAASGATFAATREGSAIGGVRGIWSPNDLTMYALSSSGLYRKNVGAGDWVLLAALGAGTSCPNAVGLTGVVVSGAPRLLAICRMQATIPRGNRLLVFELPNLTPVVTDLPDVAFTDLAGTADGTAWLVAPSQVVQVAEPYGVTKEIDVERRSPATGKLGPLNEVLTDVAVMQDGSVFLSAARQNLFWWDGTRFVRVTSSQGSSAAYVALASFGDQLYAAYESGIDLLFRSR